MSNDQNDVGKITNVNALALIRDGLNLMDDDVEDAWLLAGDDGLTAKAVIVQHISGQDFKVTVQEIVDPPEVEMESNPAYIVEARKIAGSVVAEGGDEWGRADIINGKCDASDEVVIAMRALMYARGERTL